MSVLKQFEDLGTLKEELFNVKIYNRVGGGLFSRFTAEIKGNQKNNKDLFFEGWGNSIESAIEDVLKKFYL